MEFRVLSSLAKVFADECPQDGQLMQATMLQNEVYSFQVAYYGEEYLEDVEIRAEGSLAPYMTLSEVGLVPSLLPAGNNHDNYILRDQPGLYPDPLLPFHAMKKINKGIWRSVWVSVKPEQVTGKQRAEVVIAHPERGELVRAGIDLTILPISLPKQKLICTMWFHVDGIAAAHHVEPYSEQGFALIEAYMRMAAEHGINMILTPVFTPPLDTAVGGERMTVQLVDVEKKGGAYTFGFDRLHRYIEIAKRCGIEYLEISHLFTQWGAQHAPKVMAIQEGKYEQIFGWDTDAAGEEYVEFLRALMPQLLAVLRESGMGVYFHVSDEPSIEHLEQYQKVSAILRELVDGYPIIDALSSFEFYRTGALEHPIPASNHIEPFLEAKIPDLWTYYCVGQWNEVSNRFFAMPSERNRVLGLQLYKYEIAGFLQWGYNFYNVRQSLWSINPYEVTDAGGSFPSGDAFVVYPYQDGCIPSLRLEVFREALQDLRALQLAQELCGREAVMAVLEEGIPPITFKQYPHNAQWLLGVREKINTLIQDRLGK